MSRPTTIRPATLLALAFGGVLAGHAITYRLLLPDPQTRTAELARTGHGYLGVASGIGLAIAVVAIAAVFLRGLSGAEADRASARVRWLAGFQLATFLLLELIERVATGPGSTGLASVLGLGLAIQVLVAVAIAWLVGAILATAGAVAGRRGHAPVSRAAVRTPRPVVAWPSAPWRRGLPGRAPPPLPAM